MSGQMAFDRADASAREAEVKTLASANAVADERLAKTPPAAGSTAPASRRVAGRVFVNRGGTWTDLAYKPGGSTVTVAPYSPAYFALVRALPELAPWLSVGEAVIIAGGRVSIRIETAGLTEWRGNSLTATVRDFRAR